MNIKKMVKTFSKNTRASSSIQNMPIILISLLIAALFAVALVPTIITEWLAINTTAWEEATGGVALTLLWDLVPFILVAGVTLALVLALIVWKGKGKG